MRASTYFRTAAWGSAVILTLSSIGCDDRGTTPGSNRPPVATDEIPEQVVVAGKTRFLDLSSYFTDPDGDSLSYSAAVSDGNVATVSTSASSLQVDGLAPGSTTVTATAIDADGSTATQTFALTVRTEPSVDRHRLVALFEATGGARWTTNTGWMSHDPVSEWYGVETDEEGRVTALLLSENGLAGPIPSAIGGLSHLHSLDLSLNALSGPIPAELFRLSSLANLNLTASPVEGSLPSQLARLRNLRELHLRWTKLRGPFPTELSDLANLEVLDLSFTSVDDSIPPELGKLAQLKSLNLGAAGIKGRIPAELGDLASLEELNLEGNSSMFGRIPPELGGLSNLTNLNLANIRLGGPIPVELANLAELETLALQGNALVGSIPAELGRLVKLRRLYLSGNSFLEGTLPLALTALRSLEELVAGFTEVCAPDDTVFTRWLEGVPKRRVRSCGGDDRAYLVQSVQSRRYPVPLMAGEPALLRVFPTTHIHAEETLPPVRATFYHESGDEHVVDIPQGSTVIPFQVEEGRLDLSVNAEIPGSVVQPGLELVVDIDPGGTLDPELEVIKRVPAEGRLKVEVLEMPTFDVTVVPFLWASNPDSAILELTSGMTGEDTLFRSTRTLLPVADMIVTVHDPVVTEDNNSFNLVRLTQMIRETEGGGGHYLGTISGEVVGGRGWGSLGGRTAFSIPDSRIIAHEFGHNFNLSHAACGGARWPDPSYPFADGSIGAWGLDPLTDTLIGPDTPDLMSYCSPAWVSDYHFTNAARFRISDEAGTATTTTQQRVLFLWGGVDAEGTPHLDPAFVLDAPASLPRTDGPHRIVGRDADGIELFALRFEMPVIADGDGSSSFVFSVPVREGWADALTSITLSGPGGSFTLDRSTDLPMAILRDPESGQIRRIMRDLPPGPAGLEAAERQGTETGFEVLFSRGIPDPADWRR